MRHVVHRLRQKPESTRRIISFTIALGVTALIFTAWLGVKLDGAPVERANVADSVENDSSIQVLPN
jgi:hypothetical protein